MTTLARAEEEALQDAERYRFLRENWTSVDIERPGGLHRLLIGSDDLDAMIDRYRREDQAREADASQRAPQSAAA